MNIKELKPCSFGQAMVMMEKGAVMKDDDGLFFKLDEKRLFVWACSHQEDEIVWEWWLADDLNISINELLPSQWQYVPWFKDGVVDQRLKDYCDEILNTRR